jgi:hypothetical protein
MDEKSVAKMSTYVDKFSSTSLGKLEKPCRVLLPYIRHAVFAGMPLECVEAVIEIAELLDEKVDTYDVSEEYRKQGEIDGKMQAIEALKKSWLTSVAGPTAHRNLVDTLRKELGV